MSEFLLLAPLLLFFVLTIGLGLVVSFLEAAEALGSVAAVFTQPLSDPFFRAGLFHAAYVSGTAAVLSVALGAAGAYLVWRAPARLRGIHALYRVPIILPHIIVAFLIMLLVSRTGLLSALLLRLGVIAEAEDFPLLLYSPNGIGMIAAYVYKQTPFVMLLALGMLERTPRQLVTTAKMLGAGELRVFWSVIVPSMSPALHQAFLLCFLYGIGGFEVPYLLGATRPQMPAIYIYSSYFHASLQRRPQAAAALMVIALGAVLFVLLYSALFRVLGRGVRLRFRTLIPNRWEREMTRYRWFMVTALFVLVFILPLLLVVLQAVALRWSYPNLVPEALGLRSIRFLVANAAPMIRSIGFSVLYSLCCVALAFVLCAPAALVLARRHFPGKAALEAMLLFPAFLPSISYAVGLHHGLIHAGLVDSFPGVVVVLTAASYPYMLRALIAGFQALRPEYDSCAHNLGAGLLRRILCVHLPMIGPAAVAGASVVFLVAFSDYFLVFLIGGGVVPSFTGFLFPFLTASDRSIGAALSLIFLLAPITLFVLLDLSLQRYYRRRGMQ